MHRTITFSMFCDAFRDADRNENFTYEGKRCLFDYLEDYEDSTGCPVELDIIALCCEFDEAPWQAIVEGYHIDLSDCEDDDERVETVRSYLEDHTMIVGSPLMVFLFTLCFD